jgi:hypothetical protein
MSAAPDEIFVPATTVVEIDANAIAAIIADCGAPEALAVKAANLIIDHLIEVHRHATRKQ